MMLTLRDHIKYAGQRALLRQLIAKEPEDYPEFIDCLYEDLDVLVGLMEADAKDFGSSSEDELNRELVRLLKARCYHASHDTDEGGHVDIHVKSGDDRFSWLGEAKLDNGPAYIESGLTQLTDRYARATPGHNCGGLIVYFQKDRITTRFKEWRERHEKNDIGLQGLVTSDCAARPNLAFFSEFVHERIGSDGQKYRVRHLAVSLFRPASA